MSIGYFQWTKIGCFRWTRSGSFRRTLTPGYIMHLHRHYHGSIFGIIIVYFAALISFYGKLALLFTLF